MTKSELFYEFENNTMFNRCFTWAATILPRSPMIDRECPECDAVENYPSGAFDVILEGGSSYPDVLGCGAYPFLIASERVVEVWQANGVRSFHTHVVGVAEIRARKLQNVPPPRYFRIEIDGRCEVDLKAGGIEVVKFCSECHHLVTQPSPVPGFRMAPGSWDGSPLFRDPVLYPRVNFCTGLVLDLARQHKLTNFRFEPMEQRCDFGSKGIDYMRDNGSRE